MFTEVVLVTTLVLGGVVSGEGRKFLPILFQTKQESLSPLSTALEQYVTSSENKTNNFRTMANLFNQKVRTFDRNLPELACFINDLIGEINWRSGRIVNSTVNFDELTRENIEQYLNNNMDYINFSAKTIPAGLLNLTNKQDQRVQLRKVWQDESLHDIQLRNFYLSCRSQISKKIEENIRRVKEVSHINVDRLSYLDSYYYQQLRFNKTAGKGLRQTDIANLKSTAAYLIGQATTKNSISAVYLYITSSLNFFSNNLADAFVQMIHDKKADCKDAMLFYYSILRSRGENPSIYYYIDKSSSIGHAFGAIKTENKYYFYDNTRIFSHENFYQGLKEYLPAGIQENQYIKRLDPNTFLRIVHPDPLIQTDYINIREAERLAPKQQI